MLIGCSETELVMGRDMLAKEGEEHRTEIGQLSMEKKPPEAANSFLSRVFGKVLCLRWNELSW